MVLLFVGVAHAAPPLEPGDCHKIGRLYATEIAASSLQSSPLHQVAHCARVRGHMAQFEIDTRLGTIRADSVEMLALRVQELPALEALDQATRTGTYADAMKSSAEERSRRLERVLLNPVQTVKNLPEGALRFFERTLAKVGETAQNAADRAGRLGEQGSPYDSATAPISAADTREPEPWYAKGASGAQRMTLDWIGYYKTRRALAERLDVDPYSTNPLLKERLDALAWSSFAGEKSLSLALGATGTIATRTMSLGSRVDKVVWQLDPDEIAHRNLERLKAYRCGEPEARGLLNRGKFSPTLQTAFTDRIIELDPEAGCSDLLELATYAKSELETRYLVNALHLLTHFHNNDKEHKRFVLIGSALALETGKAPRSALVLPLPVDELEWNEYTQRFFDAAEFRRSDKTLLVAGNLTRRAARELTRRGWSVVERVPYAGAPPYG